MSVEAVNEKAPDQFRLSRLNIFLFDFNQARRFSGYILRKKLHAVKNPQAKAKLVHAAFNTSLIVSYSRPFHKSNDTAGLCVSLREAVQAVLSEGDEIALHHRVIDKRDRVFAHSDAAAHEIKGFNYDGSTVQIYKTAFEPLTRDETRLLSTMILKWIAHVEKLRSESKLAFGSQSS
jgi:hypothetical protein